MRVRSSSRFSRVISEAWSATDGRGGTPGTAALDRIMPSRTTARQVRNIDGEIPTSIATCISGRPLVSNNATTSHRGVSGNLHRCGEWSFCLTAVRIGRGTGETMSERTRRNHTLMVPRLREHLC